MRRSVSKSPPITGLGRSVRERVATPGVEATVCGAGAVAGGTGLAGLPAATVGGEGVSGLGGTGESTRRPVDVSDRCDVTHSP